MKMNFTKCLFVAGGVLTASFASAQTIQDYDLNGVVNDAKLVLDVMEGQYPGYIQQVNEVFERNQTFSNKSGGTYEINLVVHVVWNTNNPEENIPDSVIYNQVDILNADYSRQNADTSNLRPIFLPVAGNPDIQFNLVGIERVETQATFTPSFTGMPDNVKQTANGGSDAYDTEHYLNIWVCQIQPLFGSALFGYAYPPAGLSNWPAGSEAPSADLEGVVLDYRTVGSNNPVPYPNPQGGGSIDFLGRTAVHEVGHYLGLRHIWGDGGGIFGGDSCGADDGCADTPNQGAQSNFDCNTSNNTCTDSIGGAPDPNDLPDLIENYMDYSSEACSNMFTMDQVVIMRSVLENERIGLLSSVASVGEVEEKKVTVYPNPAKEVLTIQTLSENHEETEIFIINMLGEKIWGNPLTSSGVITVDLTEIPNGIYFVVYSEGNHTSNEKVVVSK